jgi:hypothetical protein
MIIDVPFILDLILVIVTAIISVECILMGRVIGFSRPWKMIAIGFAIISFARVLFIPALDKGGYLNITGLILLFIGFLFIFIGKTDFYRFYKNVGRRQV